MPASSISLRRGARSSISVVMPVLNEAASLAQLLPLLADTLTRTEMEWEIVIVNDGGSDALDEVVAAFERSRAYSNVQLLRLSRNFGKEAALTAGLNAARGDAVLSMDGDGQHPVQLIPQLIAHWRAGDDMVIPVPESRAHEPRLLGMAKRAFYRFMQGGERFHIPPSAGDFRLMDRRVVDALLQLPERTRFMKGLYAWLGFRTRLVPYEVQPRMAGSTKFPLRRLIELASLGITSFSMKPLRFVSIAGALVSLGALSYGLYILVETLVVGNPVSGWATLASAIMLLSGIQLLCLGVIAEYLGRVFEESKQRPLYVLDECTDHSRLGRRDPVLKAMP